MTCFLLFAVLALACGCSGSFIRHNSTSYIGTNGEIVIEESERDFYLNVTVSGLCTPCSGICPRTPQCAAVVSLMLDGCGCCKICARQLAESCDRENICDQHKGLYCDEHTRTCKARHGRNCFVADKWYENGALFSPSCRIACSCIDGDIGCFQNCKPPPPGCTYPRLVRSSSNCCGEWRCSSRPSDFVRGEGTTSLTFRGSCILQTSDWSPCSKTCNFGVSERVTNDNDECKMKKETRLCIIRPCKETGASRKSKRSCRRNMRRPRRVRYSLSGCLSSDTFRPRYCGTCRHPGKCCRPSATKTIDIDFRCEDLASTNSTTSYTITRKLMVVQKCKCGKFCNDNDFTQGSIQAGLGGDTFHDT